MGLGIQSVSKSAVVAYRKFAAGYSSAAVNVGALRLHDFRIPGGLQLKYVVVVYSRQDLAAVCKIRCRGLLNAFAV